MEFWFGCERQALVSIRVIVCPVSSVQFVADRPEMMHAREVQRFLIRRPGSHSTELLWLFGCVKNAPLSSVSTIPPDGIQPDPEYRVERTFLTFERPGRETNTPMGLL